MAVGLPALNGVTYVDGPPPATTGGFGEDTCRMCHLDYDLNDRAGSLVLEGIPESYSAGQGYIITIRLAHPRLERGGFEMAARFASGERAGQQAGLLESVEARTWVVRGEDGAVQYVRQTRSGSAPESKGAIQWAVRWKAPEEAAGPVVFHVSANASNFDDSPLGDFPYLKEVTSRQGTGGEMGRILPFQSEIGNLRLNGVNRAPSAKFVGSRSVP
jgi:hypothetical protein